MSNHYKVYVYRTLEERMECHFQVLFYVVVSSLLVIIGDIGIVGDSVRPFLFLVASACILLAVGKLYVMPSILSKAEWSTRCF